MRAVILTEIELASLLDRLARMKSDALASSSARGATKEEIQAAHATFHHVVVRWITEVGGDPLVGRS